MLVQVLLRHCLGLRELDVKSVGGPGSRHPPAERAGRDFDAADLGFGSPEQVGDVVAEQMFAVAVGEGFGVLVLVTVSGGGVALGKLFALGAQAGVGLGGLGGLGGPVLDRGLGQAPGAPGEGGGTAADGLTVDAFDQVLGLLVGVLNQSQGEMRRVMG